MDDVSQGIRELALRNAAKFGKANGKALFGQALAKFPELKKDIAAAKEQIGRIVEEVNALTPEKLTIEIDALSPLEKKIQTAKTLKPFKNAVKGKVVTRFAPSPSGPMHIAHAYMLNLNYKYAKMYDGTFILRIEDTNPENIYEPAYDLLTQDAAWLTDNDVAQVIVQSDRLGLYYDYAEKLVGGDAAYVCTCATDVFRALVFKKEACPCRELGIKEHQIRYAQLFSTYKPGEAVLRTKTDITHPNPAMRDFPIMRINEHPHPRTGTRHRVWPLMNLAVFVDDVELGVTHIVRAKEHRDNAKRQEYLYTFFGKPFPETLFVGRINFSDMRVSCSKTKALIEEGKYTGWEDIRIPFMLPMRRRGYQKDAFGRYAVEIGTSETDKTVKKADYFRTLDAFNRELIDSIANRYFFIQDPVKIRIIDADLQTLHLSLHPDFEARGSRELTVTEEFYIERADADKLEPGMHRLMDCLNFLKKSDRYEYHSGSYEIFKQDGKRIMHWLPVTDKLITVRVHMPDGSVITGKGEEAINCLSVGDIVQLERFGFCRLDAQENGTAVFWFAHR
jgi:glutamyl-tRNA synthetase